MQHPYVVQFMEAFLDTKNEQLCLVQEFMNSDNLESLINSRANKNAEDNIFFEESIVWKCLIQTVLSLEQMHSHSIIHRDVKSANIFINIPGRDNAKPSDAINDDDLKRADFKIADLNIAVMTGHGQMRTTMNGTPFFCSLKEHGAHS